MTSHGLTLSIAAHFYICSLLNDDDKTMNLFLTAMESDSHDIQRGAAQECMHTGVMGATINVFLRVFAGLDVLEDRICLNPHLPKDLKSIKI